MPPFRLLKCLIEGESIVFSVTADRDFQVSELKEVIQRKRELDTLKNEHPYTLELWKVSVIEESLCEVTSHFFQPKDSDPIAAVPHNTLRQRIRSMGDDLPNFADKLDPSARIFSIFPRQPDREYIQIIVRAGGKWE
jgi:hypothetical protein